ncbi:MAG: MFS transporter [Candidatus Omnitrophica bacterium]|nr:MFS transporter [Candidatus Omnitrophota bacterium]
MRIKKNRLWVYFFPALMDLSVAAVLIFSAIRAVELGAKPVIVGMLGSVWGITYFVSSLILSRIITRKNSAKFMIFSCASFVCIGLFFGFFETLRSLFILLFAGGLFSAFFFVGFQLFMEHSSGTSASRSSAFYTLSWSGGMAFGSIAEGFFMNRGLLWSQLPILIPALAVISGILMFQRTSNKVAPHAETPNNNIADSVVEAYTKIAWIEIFTVSLVTSGVRYLLPKMAISFFHFSHIQAALTVFLFFIFQAASGFFSAFFKFLGYNLAAHNLLKLLAAAGLIATVLFPCSFSVFLFVCILGIYSGHAFWASVFYAINHRIRAGFNVGINESLVGIASVAGPFLLGIMLNIGLAYFMIFPCFVFILSGFLPHPSLRKFCIGS